MATEARGHEGSKKDEAAVVDGAVLLPDEKPSRPPPARAPEPAPARKEAPTSRPELSVVLLNERTSSTIRCLHALSALEPEIPGDLEAVVVYTSSSGAAPEIEFGFNCRWVRSENRRPGACRNLGISKARADRVALLSSDSVPQAGWLRAAAAMDPETEMVKTGPEPPLDPRGGSGTSYTAMNNPLSAILWPRDSGGRKTLKWHQVFLRNLVASKKMLKKTGRIGEQLPDEIAAADFLLRASSFVTFETDPKLRALTDSYPCGAGDLWDEVFGRGVEAGAGLGGYTHILGRSTWVLGWAIGPWIVMNFLVFSPLFRIVFLIGYPLIMLSQIPRLSRGPGKQGPIAALLSLFLTQCALIAGVQTGLARCLLKWLSGRKPFEG